LRRLQDRIVVVAGGAGGIGTATSLRLASEGAKVVVGDLNAGEAETVAERIRADGGSATACAVDLADGASIERLFAHAVATHGGVDLLHCNAAGSIGEDLDALEVPLDVWHASIAINLTGYFLCTRAAIPLMLARGGGAIVYTSSGAALNGEDTRVSYGSAKAGVNALMRHVALRWGKEGIRANVVSPGLVMTAPARLLPRERLDELLARTHSPRLGEPEDIAAMVAMLLSPDAEWINGQVHIVDGMIR
jgi:NAD(P)-dependent dehydrogenase (short-subunit alcohol dehydrogenase family)